MKELIDLFAKLVIATFSFIGPSFTLFIGLFYKQLDRSIAEYNAQLKTFLLVKGDINDTTKIEEIIKEIKTATKKHDPLRQVKWVFGSLFCSIIFIGVFYFERSQFWNCTNILIKGITIGISGLLFTFSIWKLWNVFCIIIDAKKAEEEVSKRKEENRRLRLSNAFKPFKP